VMYTTVCCGAEVEDYDSTKYSCLEGAFPPDGGCTALPAIIAFSFHNLLPLLLLFLVTRSFGARVHQHTEYSCQA
jgi:hypothetical protein